MAREKRNKKKRTFTGTFVGLFMVLFMCVVSFAILSQINQISELQKQEAILERQTEEEQKKSIQLQNQKEYYNSDAYIEKIAREQLGLVKPNELLFVNKEK